MKTLNDQIAVAPIEFGHNSGQTERMAAGFVGSDKTARTLVKSKLLFDSDKMKSGTTVYFRADVAHLPQIRTKLLHKDSNGKETEFILVPAALVVAADE